MKILIVGSGAREHALGWKLRSESLSFKLAFSPGNGGTRFLGENFAASDFVSLAKVFKPDFVVIGPEAPLAEGLADHLENLGFRVFGPVKRAAQLEASKIFAKSFMERNKIPTAKFKIFEDYARAKNYLKQADYPLVVKADGLAQGKGVVVCKTQTKAENALENFMVKKTLGEAGARVLVEEFLEGSEVSILAFFDGENFIYLPPCRDFKRLSDGDLGPNTGGMGSICPVIYPKTFWETFENEVAQPFKKGLEKEGIGFRGLIYFGLMLTPVGMRVLEFNVRFGDPETQTLVCVTQLPFLELMQATRETMLKKFSSFIFLDNLAKNPVSSVCVVLASPGYPAKPESGQALAYQEPQEGSNVLIFHAGTKFQNGSLVTSGGRVMSVVGRGKTLADASAAVYQEVSRIHFDGMQFRRDIGKQE